ncbi:WD40/YVTN/BNR-like repeat-containing protein, partial [Anaerolinea sp.]|uniref:WD40/YVTN/BNR-like repeat-containing protein n=1 Tax=Anaerolinea sp. TaxID=1872519 RepID=UPI003A1024D9
MPCPVADNQAISQPARSAPDEPVWQSLGLSGQTIFTLAAHPTDAQTIFAKVEQGRVYRTTDGGEHWTALPLNNPFLYEWLVAPLHAVRAG